MKRGKNEGAEMGSNRSSEIETTHLRITQTEHAIATIHDALRTAFTNTATMMNDPRSLTRLQVYQILSNALSKDILLSFHADLIQPQDIEDFFTKQTNDELPKYYTDADEPDSLSEHDKSFFIFVISVFRALTYANFYYHKLAAHLEKFTPEFNQLKVLQIENAALEIKRILRSAESLHTTDVDIRSRTNNVINLENALRSTLHNTSFSGGHISYATRHKEIAEQYQELSLLLNELDRESIRIHEQKIKIKNSLATEDIKTIEKEILSYNERVAQFKDTSKIYRDKRVDLASTAYSLYEEIKGKINFYTQAAATLNNNIQKRNAQLQYIHDQMSAIGNRLNQITKDLKATHTLTHHVATPIDALLCMPHSSPAARCKTLKLNGWMSRKHDAEWTTLGNTITEQLNLVNEPVALAFLDAFTQPMTNAKSLGKEVLEELRKYEELKPVQTLTGYAHDRIDSNDKMLENRNSDIEKRFKNINVPQPLSYHRKLIPAHQHDSSTPAIKHGFIKRHWKALAGGMLLGAGIAVATVLSAGIVPLAAGAITALGVGFSILAGGVAGTLGASGVAAAYDYHYSKYQIVIDDDKPDEAPDEPYSPPYKPLVFRRSAKAIEAVKSHAVAFASRGSTVNTVFAHQAERHVAQNEALAGGPSAIPRL